MRKIVVPTLEQLSAEHLSGLYFSETTIPLRVNMVFSADGKIAGPDGSTQSISSPSDMRIFNLLRTLSDVVLVGASTAISDKYKQPRVREEFTFLNRPAPAMCIISRSLNLWHGAPLFANPEWKPIVVTQESDDVGWHERLAELQTRAEVNVLPSTELVEVTEYLHHKGFESVLCEGGPKVISQLTELSLINEFCFTRSVTEGPKKALSYFEEWLDGFEPLMEIETPESLFVRAIPSID